MKYKSLTVLRKITLILFISCIIIVLFSSLTVAKDGNTGNDREEVNNNVDGVVIKYYINQTSTKVGSIKVKYRLKASEGIDEVRVYISDDKYVIDKEGFLHDNDSQFLKLAEDRSSAEIIYTVQVNSTDTFGTASVDTKNWAFFERSIVKVGTTIQYNRIEKKDGHSETIIIARNQSGYISDEYIYLGQYEKYSSNNGEQSIVLIESNYTNNKIPPKTIKYLTKMNDDLSIESQKDMTTGFILPSPIRGGGAAMGNSFWLHEPVDFEGGGNVLFHEYFHVHQRFYPNENAEWIVEGSASYYESYFQWRYNNIPTIGFYHHVSTTTYSRRLLNRTDISDGSLAEYEKGRRVMAGLDILIRNETNGNKTLMDAMERLNKHPGRVSLNDFQNIISDLAGTSVKKWFDKYVRGANIPPIPISLDSVYRKQKASKNPPVEVVDGKTPTDPDSDGMYEDLNGDKKVNIIDLRVFIESYDDPSVRNYPEFYDFNKNSDVTVIDVRVFMEEVNKNII